MRHCSGDFRAAGQLRGSIKCDECLCQLAFLLERQALEEVTHHETVVEREYVLARHDGVGKMALVVVDGRDAHGDGHG